MENPGTGTPEDRIAALELKLTGTEALVKGLIAELLDMKALTRSIFQETEEDNRQDMKRAPAVPGIISPALAVPSASPSFQAPADGSTIVRPRDTHQPAVPVAPAEPVMVRIMQSDGTMKMEPRYGEAKHIDSSGGYGHNRKDTPGKSKQSPLIYAAEKDKPDRAKV
jgi:hypothetical protein